MCLMVPGLAMFFNQLYLILGAWNFPRARASYVACHRVGMVFYSLLLKKDVTGLVRTNK